MKYSLIFDLIMVLIMLVVAVVYSRRGFLGGLLSFGGTIISVVLSSRLAQMGSAFLFEKFLYNSYLTRVEKVIEQNGGVSAEDLLDQYGGFLPESFRAGIAETAEKLISASAPDLAEKLVTQVLQPLTTPMITMVLFFICFALCRLVISLFVALLANANNIPLLGDVNKGLGFCLGLLAGGADVFIILCVVYALMALTSGGLPVLNPTDLDGSLTLKVFEFINPFI